MTAHYILNLLPGDYLNDGIVWSIYDNGKMIFSGTWDEAVKLPEEILSKKVDRYESKILEPRKIDRTIWKGWKKVYVEDSAE